jgi:uncharacterized membrane protein (UPF0127 family)
MNWRLFNFILLIPLLLVACNPEREELEPATIQDWLPLSINGVELRAQIAIAGGEMQKGLMYRESLPEDSGMLFIYKEEARRSFWMANTPLPLDIGFFDRKGLLLEIHRLVPYDTNPVASRSREIQFALEMPKGWFAGKGLYPGVKLDLEKVRSAVVQRGFNPSNFGLPAAE